MDSLTRNGACNESLLQLTRDLVRIPSRSAIDPYGPVFALISDWLRNHGILSTIVSNEGAPVALMATLGDPERGSTYLLNATVDTAEFGDESSWSMYPLSAGIHEGWLYGRGSADSKAGVSVFCHVAATLLEQADRMKGALTLVFDAEEHSGIFLGIERSLASLPQENKIAGAMIGYPGQDKIVVGCRGFYRATVRVHGKAAHSGSSTRHGINAIVRASSLVQKLQQTALPMEITPFFPLPPQFTITGMKGGAGCSTVPDLCTVELDVRLTPTFQADSADRLIKTAVNWLDREDPRAASTEVEIKPGWPAYVVPRDNQIVESLRRSAEMVMGKQVPLGVAGPSSVGNLLALRGIPATAGFGVINRNFHAADECILIESLGPVYQVYLGAVHELLLG